MKVIITSDTGEELARVNIDNVNPKKATIAILQACSPLRKERSDKGKKRGAEAPLELTT